MTGGVRFDIQTPLVERVIERALEAGICITSARRVGADRLDMWISARGERTLKKLLDDYHICYRVVCVRGLTRFTRALRRECALIIMLALCAMFMVWVSGRVWMIDISGADDANILRALNDMGARAGTPKADIDARALEDALIARLSGYSFVGVKLSGVVLKVEAVREHDAPEVFTLGDARDIVADADAVILSIDVMAGRAMVKSGDTVRKGQILIAGEERADVEGAMKRVRAEGAVIARTWVKSSAASALEYARLTRTGRESVQNTLNFKWFERPLGGENPFSVYQAHASRHIIGGLFVPVYIERTRYMECEWTLTPIDEEIARGAAYMAALAEARKRVPEDAREAQIWAEYTVNGAQVAAKVVIEITRDIAVGERAHQHSEGK